MKKIVRGKKNPFIVVGKDASLTGCRWKVAPTAPTMFKAGDEVFVVEGRDSVQVSARGAIETWTYVSQWEGI